MPEYTVLTVASMIGVVTLEGRWRTGIFTSARYWCSMVIVFAFQILVDGWLTKLSDPIVLYGRDQFLGIRFPWDIPIEDFGFGFAMITAVLMLWQWNLNRRSAEADSPTEADG